MKVTRLGPTEPTLSLTSTLSGGGGNVGPSGQVPTSNGSNSVAWGSNVATVFSNGSNQLTGPTLNLASGSNIIFTLDSGPAGSGPSNTLRIHALPLSSTGISVADEGATLATPATALNFVGPGVVAAGTGSTKTITVADSFVSAAKWHID